jgi:peptidoglycan/xylan/chitin deacetylase (PgdA/CDA1 family)
MLKNGCSSGLILIPGKMFDPRIHSLTHLAKAFLGNLAFSDELNYPSNELLVLNYHSTPKKLIPAFKSQLEFFKEHFNIIGAHQLSEFYSEKGLKGNKGHLLFTFDDGLSNNRYALDVLSENSINAFVFVVPGFINCPGGDQKQYYIRNIRPIINPKIDCEKEDFAALSWADLRRIVDQGHHIGSHTMTHSMVAGADENTLLNEIVESKKLIEKQLHVKVNSFCSINDSLKSVGSAEKKQIAGNYSYHFTTLPGYNSIDRDPLFIKRRNIEVFWLEGAVKFAVGKKDLRRWREKIDQYKLL